MSVQILVKNFYQTQAAKSQFTLIFKKIKKGMPKCMYAESMEKIIGETIFTEKGRIMNNDYPNDLPGLLGADLPARELYEALEKYHSSEIAQALEEVTVERRRTVYAVLGLEWTAEIFSCYENVGAYIRELSPEDAAGLLEYVIHTEDEFEEDYAKFGGLTEEEEQEEPVRLSVRKRLPWLIILLLLGITVSAVTGIFETVIATIPAIVFFQSMILGMAGNVGTQSLAVTIRTLSDMESEEDVRWRRKQILKELRIGFINGILIGMVAFIVVLGYLAIMRQEIIAGHGYLVADSLIVAGVIGVSMLVSITLSGFIGTALPMLLSRLHIDPAVASGPFITTLNDIIAVVVYYGLTGLMLYTVTAI